MWKPNFLLRRLAEAKKDFPNRRVVLVIEFTAVEKARDNPNALNVFGGNSLSVFLLHFTHRLSCSESSVNRHSPPPRSLTFRSPFSPQSQPDAGPALPLPQRQVHHPTAPHVRSVRPTVGQDLLVVA